MKHTRYGRKHAPKLGLAPGGCAAADACGCEAVAAPNSVGAAALAPRPAPAPAGAPALPAGRPCASGTAKALACGHDEAMPELLHVIVTMSTDVVPAAESCM